MKRKDDGEQVLCMYVVDGVWFIGNIARKQINVRANYVTARSVGIVSMSQQHTEEGIALNFAIMGIGLNLGPVAEVPMNKISLCQPITDMNVGAKVRKAVMEEYARFCAKGYYDTDEAEADDTGDSNMVKPPSEAELAKLLEPVSDEEAKRVVTAL